MFLFLNSIIIDNQTLSLWLFNFVSPNTLIPHSFQENWHDHKIFWRFHQIPPHFVCTHYFAVVLMIKKYPKLVKFFKKIHCGVICLPVRFNQNWKMRVLRSLWTSLSSNSRHIDYRPSFTTILLLNISVKRIFLTILHLPLSSNCIKSLQKCCKLLPENSLFLLQ